MTVTTGFAKVISKKQIQRIISCKPSKVIVMYDNDSWFDYDRIRKEIPVDVDFTILPKGKDPNDLSWLELHSVFEEINGQSRIRKRINVAPHNQNKYLSKMQG